MYVIIPRVIISNIRFVWLPKGTAEGCSSGCFGNFEAPPVIAAPLWAREFLLGCMLSIIHVKRTGKTIGICTYPPYVCCSFRWPKTFKFIWMFKEVKSMQNLNQTEKGRCMCSAPREKKSTTTKKPHILYFFGLTDTKVTI